MLGRPRHLGGAFWLSTIAWLTAARDATREEGASGAAVVETCVTLLSQSGIFPPDFSFLRRIAWVESKDGEDTDTYREGYHGGIWQVDLIGFQDTQNVRSHPGLTNKFTEIEQHFDISWGTVTWEDLRKPLYSILAARLLLSNKPEAIPDTIESQAEYWKNYYNSNDPNAMGTVEKFITDVEALESSDGTCDMQATKMLVMIVMDASGSIGQTNYQNGLAFLEDLIVELGITEGGSMVGMTYYDEFPTLYFNFTDDASTARALVSAAPYPGGTTYTGLAIDASVNSFEALSQDRQWSRVCIILTDGQSHDSVVEPARRAQESGITMFTIGIGSGVDTGELLEISNGVAEHVFDAGAYDSLDNILWTLKGHVCTAPVTLESPTTTPPEPLELNVGRGKITYVASSVPAEGITVDLSTSMGSVTGYASYQITTPSEVFHDYRLPAGKPTFVPYPLNDGDVTRRLAAHGTAGNVTNVTLYMGYEGYEDENEFQVAVTLGNTEQTNTEQGTVSSASGPLVESTLAIAVTSIGAITLSVMRAW